MNSITSKQPNLIDVFHDRKVFCQNNSAWFIKPQPDKIKSKTSNTKKICDITATGLWLAVVAFCAYKTGLLNKKSAENVLNKAKSLEHKYSKLENLAQYKDNVKLDELLHEKNSIQKIYIKMFYKLGEKFENTKAKMGDELFNNFLNSLGKIIIMPMVIFANPFGSKKTTKEDKISVTIREPLSVIATFTLQGAFDKMFNVYMPKILKNNMYESKAVKSSCKNGKIAAEQFDNIKYNSTETKRLFVNLTNISQEKGGLKGILTEVQAKKLLTLNPFDSERFDAYKRAFDREVKNGIINKKHLEYVKKKFNVVADSVGNFELAKLRPKIAMNIIVVVILSRIFLNVIHGKTIKALKLNKNKEGE